MAPARTPPVPARRASLLGPRLLLAVAAPIAFFCALEGGLRLAGFGRPTELFIPDGKPGSYRTNPNFTAPFIPPSFGIQPLNFRLLRRKEPGSVRVVVVGESAAQGMPDPDFGFAAQLRAQLRARFPGRSVEVCNLGITAIDSHVVYRMVRQIAGFEPDLLVIYMGNNEVVGPYGPGCAYLSTAPPLWFIRASVWARGTRTGQLLAALAGRLAPAKSRVRDWKGMETFSQESVRGDDPRLEAVYGNFAANLRDILALARQGGIKTVLATVVANLQDSAPFISLHRAGLTPAELAAWAQAEEAGRIAVDLGDPRSARESFEAALRIDPQYAETLFRLARVNQALDEPDLARARYLAALHWDALRFRPDPRVNEIIRRRAGEAGPSVVLVDAARTMGADSASAGPLPGHELLFDHVHFNWAGNSRLAALLADACARQIAGSDPVPAPGLDPDACAAALGYTASAELKMLQTMVQLMLRPPFSNQYTFTEDQAALKRQIELSTRRLEAPGERSTEREVVARAFRQDPLNGALALRLGVMDSESGNPGPALTHLREAEALQPRNAEVLRRRAQVLVQLGRSEEAEALLLGSLDLDGDYYVGGGALVELWGTTRQFDKGRDFFDQALRRHPANPYLRLEFATLLARAGDGDGAEREARRIWRDDPGGRPAMAALELLVRLYERRGQAAAADALTLEARGRQPGDYYNNQRLVQLYAGRNDAAGTVAALQAEAASGPFDAAEHLDLAHRLADLNRGPEMLDELGHAREVARIEGDPAQIHAIDERIAVYRARFSDGTAH